MSVTFNVAGTFDAARNPISPVPAIRFPARPNVYDPAANPTSSASTYPNAPPFADDTVCPTSIRDAAMFTESC